MTLKLALLDKQNHIIGFLTDMEIAEINAHIDNGCVTKMIEIKDQEEKTFQDLMIEQFQAIGKYEIEIHEKDNGDDLVYVWDMEDRQGQYFRFDKSGNLLACLDAQIYESDLINLDENIKNLTSALLANYLTHTLFITKLIDILKSQEEKQISIS